MTKLARGPQVLLDGAAQLAARGGSGRTMRDNVAAMDVLLAAGLVGDGTSVDGSSRTGVDAEDILLDGPFSSKITFGAGVQINAGGSFASGNIARDANWGWWQQSGAGNSSDMALWNSTATGGVRIQSNNVVAAVGGGLMVGATPSTARTINWTGNLLLPPNLNFMSSASLTGSLPANQSSVGGAGVPMNWFAVGTDNLDMHAASVNSLAYLAVTSSGIGASATGNRVGFNSTITQNTLTNAFASGDGQQDFIAGSFSSNGMVNNGGTSQTASFGSIFGLGVGALLDPSATWWSELVGMEIDVCSGPDQAHAPLRKVGIQVVSYADPAHLATVQDNSSGASIDAGLLIGRFDTAIGFRNGLLFGSANSHLPITTDGKVIAIEIGRHNTGSPPPIKTAAYGMDLLQGDFSGRAIRSNGFSVSPAGAVQVTSGLISAGNGLLIDAGGSVYSSHAIAAGGSGWVTNTLIFDDANGGVFFATTVVGGAVTVLGVLRAPVVTGATPSNPVALTAAYGSPGTGLTVNYTWTAKKTIDIGTAGATAVNIGRAAANVVVGSGGALATSATTGFLQIGTCAGTPTGVVGATGKAALIVDSTNHKVYCNDGGGWFALN